MSISSFLVLLLIAAICGGIGKSISGYSFGGCFVSIIIGFLGAYVGAYIAEEMNFPMFYVINIGDRDFPVVWSIFGSFIVSLALGIITKGSKQ